MLFVLIFSRRALKREIELANAVLMERFSFSIQVNCSRFFHLELARSSLVVVVSILPVTTVVMPCIFDVV